MSAEFDTMQPALEAEGMPEQVQPRFNAAQRRAFGSVPRLLGASLEIPTFEHLDAVAWQRTSAEGLRAGLYGPNDRNAVDGIVLNPGEYTALMRSPQSFLSSVQAKTVAAGHASNPVRMQEKEIKSGYESFRSKWERQNKVLKGLHTEQQTLTTLLAWQKDPGFNRTTEIDIVSLANQALNGTIRNMLKALKVQHELSPEEHIDALDALHYRLFRGPQTDRIANWGHTLNVARSYTGAKINLFQNRQNQVERFGARLRTDLDDFYAKHDIFRTS